MKRKPLSKTLENGKKICSTCREPKVLSEFHNHKGAPFDKAYTCKVCANERSKNLHKRRMLDDPSYKESKRTSYIKNRHGITAEEYEAKLKSQDHKCDICQVKLLSRGYGTHLDHCHKTGKLRAMLCTNCNRGLGHFQDNVKFLKEAINYLNSHNVECCSTKGGSQL